MRTDARWKQGTLTLSPLGHTSFPGPWRTLAAHEPSYLLPAVVVNTPAPCRMPFLKSPSYLQHHN